MTPATGCQNGSAKEKFALGGNRVGVSSCRTAYTGFNLFDTEEENGKEPTGESICGY